MIDMLKKIKIDDSTQYLYCGGTSYDNPVLLFIHGGPGATLMPYSHILKELEEDFIVIYWDQRGAGKSFTEDTDTNKMNLKNFIEDAKEVIRQVKDEFNKEKIFIAGHSWGSVIGANLAYQIPQYLSAYISISQVVDYQRGIQLSYEMMMKVAEENNDQTMIKRLTEVGKPPYEALQNLYVFLGMVYEVGGAYHKKIDFEKIHKANPIYTEEDFEKFNKGMQFSAVAMIEEISRINLIEDGITNFQIPMIFVTGKYDYFTPGQVIREYHDMIKAPVKEFHICDNSAHFPYVEEPEILIEIIKSVKHNY